MMSTLMAGVSASALTASLATGGDGYDWVTVLSPGLNAVSNNWGGHNARQRYTNSLFSMDAEFVRLTFAASSSGLEITTCYVGICATVGNTYDFKATPVAVTFNGGDPGFDIAANASIVSDPSALTFNAATDSLLVAFYIANTGKDDMRSRTTGSGYEMAYKVTANETNVVDVSGYSTGGASSRIGINLVEFSATGPA